VSHWGPNDALKIIVLTSQYAEEVEKASMEVGERRGSRRGQGEGLRRYKADSRRARTAGCATSISGVCMISV